ncbi:hypothetical protein HFP89_15415 [Wenzhouxiangella sp. XN79A]|uniref:hypothetical protein n=1 Tax=Wenzhouxiangella sp. XN79A TaxID=2724193 RepID=UPI00144AA7A3|nr:hypothetical protein [Wenzhouxiangella sp. XN79A]NKI36559.1 hypothetical protein [Wenzhouxiangella sp. XN79A]
MSHPIDPTGERSNHKLAAVFDTATGTDRARQRLVDETSLSADQIDVLGPDSAEANRRLLPESRGIWQTVLRSHLVLGLAGATLGLALFLILLLGDIRFVVDNPLLSVLVFVHVFTLFGLMVGGLVSLRPDQVPYLRTARSALAAGKSVLLVHAGSSAELAEARSFLKQPALKTVRTA